jgi:hypothetical protein
MVRAAVSGGVDYSQVAIRPVVAAVDDAARIGNACYGHNAGQEHEPRTKGSAPSDISVKGKTQALG